MQLTLERREPPAPHELLEMQKRKKRREQHTKPLMVSDGTQIRLPFFGIDPKDNPFATIRADHDDELAVYLKVRSS